MVEVGDKAPDFTLQSTMGEKVSLSDYAGKKNVVLAFYFLNWTPVCHGDMCSFRDELGQFEKAGAQVLGLSVDSIFAHKAWARELGITYPLLSDFNKDVSKAYGVLHDEIKGLRGVSKRSAFVLDKQGIVRYKWVTEDPMVPLNIQEVLHKIKEISR